jgi:hypothetical protein
MADHSPQFELRPESLPESLPESATARGASSPEQRRASALLPNLLTGLATVPVLLGLLGMRAVGRLGHQLSQHSEELLRGDQLPLRE